MSYQVNWKVIILDNGICPPGEGSFGGRCNCSDAPGWTETGGWSAIYCQYGQCYSSQEYDWCVGKDYSTPVGDGTWCVDDKRLTICRIINERGLLGFFWYKYMYKYIKIIVISVKKTIISK